MVGLVQRRGIFYVRRTIPDALRADMPAVLGTAGPGIFDESAPVSLKGRRAGREFWVSLGTRDEDVARDRARRLDGEADALVRLAKRRLPQRSAETLGPRRHGSSGSGRDVPPSQARRG
ncbi:DUF6538 domain-containing protein [Methylobacterium sp. E-025]|uniref:DUF6538 domain-containing protein n=1 Tax=Methylobacterium sp. E-025 TaxID=2836561 RepID=UPI00391909D7